LTAPKNISPDTLTLTRESLEQAMMTWTKKHEGPIGYEYVGLLLSDGEILEALDRVAVSMQVKQAAFCDNEALDMDGMDEPTRIWNTRLSSD